MNLDLGQILWTGLVGGLTGGFLGYFLAKRDQRRVAGRRCRHPHPRGGMRCEGAPGHDGGHWRWVTEERDGATLMRREYWGAAV